MLIRNQWLWIMASVLLLSSYTQANTSIPADDIVSDNIFNYHRQTQAIATSGEIRPGGMRELKALGFKTVLDLRMPEEGTARAAISADANGLKYRNLPVGRTVLPSQEGLAAFKAFVENPENLPLLIHCETASRVGMMWTYYRIHKGIDYMAAIVEGRAIGMKPDLESDVRKDLKTKSSTAVSRGAI